MPHYVILSITFSCSFQRGYGMDDDADGQPMWFSTFTATLKGDIKQYMTVDGPWDVYVRYL